MPSIPFDVIRSPERDHARISMFPSLDYKGLYHAIVQLLEVLPQVQSGMQGMPDYTTNLPALIRHVHI